MLFISCSNKPKSIYICGDHKCINKAEAKKYFEENLTLEVKIIDDIKTKEANLVELNLKKVNNKKKIRITKKKEINKKLKILTKKEINEIKSLLKRKRKFQKNYLTHMKITILKMKLKVIKNSKIKIKLWLQMIFAIL